jgi:hypothetical protein
MSIFMWAAIALYVFGGYKFWKGFRRTNYVSSFGNKLKLTLLWPGFYIYSQTYRHNFNRSLKGD